MKTGLVLEGGAMRGIYSAGVLDLFMDAGIPFDGVIGVSAGALFGVNLLSGQRGRALRYNKKYNSYAGYMGILPLLKTGNLIDTEFAYVQVPRNLDPFDDTSYRASGIPFYAVVTNLETGKPEYIQVTSVFEQMDLLRASGSMPFVSKPVKIGEKLYLDGAVSDSIPFEKMQNLGYDRLVVVLTKCRGYEKKPVPKAMADAFYRRRFPKFAQAVAERHIMYNRELEQLHRLAAKGEVFVIQPSEQIQIRKMEKDPEKIQAMYDLGQKDASCVLQPLRAFLGQI